jgi:tetratricopeptide (TPR) repeat protein
MSERRDAHSPHHLLPYYDWDALPETERTILESHALECDACFAELERGAVAVRVLRDHREEALRALGAPSEKQTRFLSWKKPWVLVPAAAGLLIVAWLFFASRPDYRDLASFPLEPESISIVRGSGANDGVSELIQVGLARLDLAQYADAERAFASAVARDPRSPRAAYLLGVTQARTGHVESAILSLDKAIELASPELRPHAEWALANAYLAGGYLQKAKDTLTVLATGTGEVADEARALLTQLPQGP